MVGKTRTRVQLCESIYAEVGLSKDESREFLESVIEEIIDALGSGETVKISSFGSFSVRQKGERIGRNPKTGEEVPITARRVVSFRPSHVLRKRINDGLSASDRGAGD